MRTANNIRRKDQNPNLKEKKLRIQTYLEAVKSKRFQSLIFRVSVRIYARPIKKKPVNTAVVVVSRVTNSFYEDETRQKGVV